MQGLPSILSLSHNELNEFNITEAQMLGYSYHDLKITLKSNFWCENDTILSLCVQHYYGLHYHYTTLLYHRFR